MLEPLGSPLVKTPEGYIDPMAMTWVHVFGAGTTWFCGVDLGAGDGRRTMRISCDSRMEAEAWQVKLLGHRDIA